MLPHPYAHQYSPTAPSYRAPYAPIPQPAPPPGYALPVSPASSADQKLPPVAYAPHFVHESQAGPPRGPPPVPMPPAYMAIPTATPAPATTSAPVPPVTDPAQAAVTTADPHLPAPVPGRPVPARQDDDTRYTRRDEHRAGI